MVNVGRLSDELTGAGLPILGCAVEAAVREASGFATWYSRAEGQVRVDWSVMPSAAQDTQASVIVLAHDGAETETERMDKLPAHARYVAALLIRASDRWAPLSAARKARVQAIIDNGADAAIARLT